MNTKPVYAWYGRDYGWLTPPDDKLVTTTELHKAMTFESVHVARQYTSKTFPQVEFTFFEIVQPLIISQNHT